MPIHSSGMDICVVDITLVKYEPTLDRRSQGTCNYGASVLPSVS